MYFRASLNIFILKIFFDITMETDLVLHNFNQVTSFGRPAI